jgi:GxxExxY protein
MSGDDILQVVNKIREIAYAIHLYHGNGYLEKVYENALVSRLRKAGFNVEQQHSISIYDEDKTIIGEYFADLLVNGNLIIELKTCRTLLNEHKSQVFHYMKATGIKHALLINFGSYRFEINKYIDA